jgi:hypothetical protein
MATRPLALLLLLLLLCCCAVVVLLYVGLGADGITVLGARQWGGSLVQWRA